MIADFHRLSRSFAEHVVDRRNIWTLMNFAAGSTHDLLFMVELERYRFDTSWTQQQKPHGYKGGRRGKAQRCDEC